MWTFQEGNMAPINSPYDGVHAVFVENVSHNHGLLILCRHMEEPLPDLGHKQGVGESIEAPPSGAGTQPPAITIYSEK